MDLADVPVEQDWKPESIADDPDHDAYVIFTSGSTGVTVINILDALFHFKVRSDFKAFLQIVFKI